MPDNTKLQSGQEVAGTVMVRNIGDRQGDEIVQIYLKDDEASVRVPNHKLCFFKRVSLIPGEETKVAFTIDAEQFMIIKEDGTKEYEPGTFTISAGGCQPELYSEALSGSKTICCKVVL
jgi:beta-glucosidase